MRFTRCVYLALAASVLYAPNVLAQNDDEEAELALIYGDKLTVSIATGSAQELRRAPAVATVITAEDILAMGATDLDQVLESVPGVHVARAPINYEPLYQIRGIHSTTNPHILMLQNGVPMTTMLSGSRGVIWGGYPVEHIARIEIIRGPGSALYGADAYSGVINIITKTAADAPGTEVGVAAGSFKTRNAMLQHGGKIGPLDVAVYLRVGSTDGSRDIIDADAQSARDARFGSHASLAPGPVNNGYDAVDGNLDLSLDKWRLRAGYKLRNNVGTGAGVASALDPVGKEKGERIHTDLSWSDPQFARDWGVGATASFLQYKQRILEHLRLSPPGTVFPTGRFPDGMIGHPDTSERQVRLAASTTYSGFSGHNLRFGIGHDDLDMYHTATIKNYLFNGAGVPVPAGPVADYSAIQPFMLPQRRKVDYLYAQDEWHFAKDWTATAGVRHDHYSDFGGTTNPRVALVWDASHDVTAKLLYGHSFRAPSFNEEYGINNPVNRGNPDLQPETIRSLEAALSWQAGKDAQVNLNVFRYRRGSIISNVPNPAPTPGATYRNAGNQHGSGAEIESVWDASRRLRLTGNYSYQRSIDDATGRDAGYAPHHQVYARADWRFAREWLFSSQLNHVADRRRTAGDARPQVPDYTTVDLSLRTSRGKQRWNLAVFLTNALNADVREPSTPGAIVHDLPMPRRALYLQASYQM